MNAVFPSRCAEGWAKVNAVFKRAHADIQPRFVPGGNEVRFSRRWLTYAEWAEIFGIFREYGLGPRNIMAAEARRLLQAQRNGLSARDAWREKRRLFAIAALRERAKRRSEKASKLLGYAEQRIGSGLPKPPKRRLENA